MRPILDDDTLPRRTVDAIVRDDHTGRIGVAGVGGSSRRGSRRRRNEDAWGHRNSRAFVVADGMGGRPDGDVAATVAVAALLDSLSGDVTDWDVSVAAAHHAVESATSERPGGAVVVALRCDGAHASVLHVGDARAYRLRNRLAEPLTRDHSIAEAIADVGVRRSESGLEPRQLAAITSFLGQSTNGGFAVCELTVHDGDRIVLCSDGVYRHLTPNAWADAADLPLAGDAANFLVEAASSAGSTDDATALVIDLASRSDSHGQ